MSDFTERWETEEPPEGASFQVVRQELGLDYRSSDADHLRDQVGKRMSDCAFNAWAIGHPDLLPPPRESEAAQ